MPLSPSKPLELSLRLACERTIGLWWSNCSDAVGPKSLDFRSDEQGPPLSRSPRLGRAVREWRFVPQQFIHPEERERGIRNLMIDAAAATAIGALNSGVVVLALALHVGASGFQIGLLAAIPLLTQVLQAPAVKLVERVRRRRLISVGSVLIARMALPVYAAVPFIDDRGIATTVLLLAAFIHYGFNVIGACSWNSWIRDLITEDRLGQFSGRRGLYGTAVSAVATMIAGISLHWSSQSARASDIVFSSLYVTGFLLGLISAAALSRVPEPRMAPQWIRTPLAKQLWQPLKDRNFRNVLRYLASWQFAVNLATPFFTVYFVRELGFSIGFILLLTVTSQLANAAVVRGWGYLTDRFTNKSVLSVATPAYIACIAAVVFAGGMTSAGGAAYLLALHVVMGAAGAGVGLAAGNIVMKLSPTESATSYMATNAFVGALAAGAAPILGGWLADFFASRKLELQVRWASPSGVEDLLGFSLAHWEFFFILSALVGLYTLHRLSAVEEHGTVPPKEVVQHVWSSARRTLRNISTVAGLRLAVSFPAGDLIKSRERRPQVLDEVFEGRNARKQESVEAIGFMLDAVLEPPAPEAELQRLLTDLANK